MNPKAEEIIKSSNRKGCMQYFVGIPFSILCGTAIFTTVPGEEKELSITITFVIITILTLFTVFWGFKNRRIGVLFTKYHAVCQNKRAAMEVNYAEIARIVGEPVDKVTKEVQTLITHRLWAYVHGGEDAVLEKEEKHRASEMLKNKHEANSTKTVTCDSCLGTTTVNAYSASPKCQYCGSSLKEELRSK